jgi:hypothetical protein
MSSLWKLSTVAVVAAAAAMLATWFTPRGAAAPNPDSTLVHVTNRIIDAVPVSPAPLRPYQVTIAVNLADGSFSDGDDAPIPDGQRFVIQTVTGSAVLPAVQRPRLTVFTQQIDANGNPGAEVGLLSDNFFAFHDQGLDDVGNAVFTFAQPVTLYADAGGKLNAYFSRSASAGFGEFRAVFSGYLTKATKPPAAR